MAHYTALHYTSIDYRTVGRKKKKEKGVKLKAKSQDICERRTAEGKDETKAKSQDSVHTPKLLKRKINQSKVLRHL